MMKSIFVPHLLGQVINQGKPNLATVVPNGFAGLTILVDWARREVCRCGRGRCKLSARETALLACLARKAGTAVSRDEILLQVWQLDPMRTATRTIDMHISLLRRKLEDDAGWPRILITVHGVGYMIRRGAISSENVHRSTSEGGFGASKLGTGVESLTLV